MKKRICFAAFLAFIANANAQYVIKKNLADFIGIEISSAVKINLIQSDSNYVTISSKDSIKKTPRIDIQGGILEIKSSFKGTMNVHLKNITSIKISDAARVECKDTLKTNNLTIHVSDAGKADILIRAKTIKAQANDAGSITLSGNTVSLDIKSSDASHVNSVLLKADSVRVVSSDGSYVAVSAIKSIDANATDGGTICILGNPPQRNTSVSEGGSIKMNYSGHPVMPRGNKALNIMETDTDYNGKKKMVITINPLIGGGFVTGGSSGATINYGASREFIIGFGSKYKVAKWNAIGWNLYYKSTDFYLAQDSGKHFPETTNYKSEKVSTQDFGVHLYDCFYIRKWLYVDGGAYLDWAFHSKHVIWDNNTPDGSTDEIKTTNLSFVNPFDYGLTFRMGLGSVSFYCNYRLSKLFQNTNSSNQPYPMLPAYTFGIIID